jgi:hypothetical protein
MKPAYQTEEPDQTEVGHLSNTSTRSGKKSANKNPPRTKSQKSGAFTIKRLVESVLGPKQLYKVLQNMVPSLWARVVRQPMKLN